MVLQQLIVVVLHALLRLLVVLVVLEIGDQPSLKLLLRLHTLILPK